MESAAASISSCRLTSVLSTKFLVLLGDAATEGDPDGVLDNLFEDGPDEVDGSDVEDDTDVDLVGVGVASDDFDNVEDVEGAGDWIDGRLNAIFLTEPSSDTAEVVMDRPRD